MTHPSDILAYFQRKELSDMLGTAEIFTPAYAQEVEFRDGPTADEAYFCPECGQPSSSQIGITLHREKSHGLVLPRKEKRGRKKIAHVCRDCNTTETCNWHSVKEDGRLVGYLCHTCYARVEKELRAHRQENCPCMTCRMRLGPLVAR